MHLAVFHHSINRLHSLCLASLITKCMVLLLLVFFTSVAQTESLAPIRDQTQADKLPVTTPTRVHFINPSAPDNIFWKKTTKFMQAAANSLGFELRVIYGDENRVRTTQSVKNAMQASPDDYFIYIYQISQGLDVLQHAEALNAKSIIINTSVPEVDQLKAGRPGNPFHHWIAHFTPDDVAAGETLARYLTEKSDAINPMNPQQIIALNGSLDSTAAADRQTGLNNFLKQRQDIKLNQLTWARWDKKLARFQTERLLQRYPGTCIIWSASDDMAAGSLEGLASISNRCNQMIVGGIDWSDWGIEAVSKGELDATVGGHFMEGAWALVLIYDHENQRKGSSKPMHFQTKMALLNKENMALSTALFDTEQWHQIDFRQFTLTHTNASSYDFSVQAVLKQLAPK
ncbi:MAG: ABC transporter substrate-binding protein [Hahellaceae bacterium]|nr:ABC transporter substrate-binding protein [Hahellaceae bacterium]MCP5210001.1 ABC transporter substrate-binding protein [Hahellaceae bacterium]